MFLKNPENAAINPEFSQKNFDCVIAVAKGVGGAITGFAHMVAHPIDTIIYPVSSLVYDASIISMAHYVPCHANNLDNLDFNALKKLVNERPNLYKESSARMHERFNAAKQFYKDFEEAEIEKQIEILSQTISSFYLPGTMVKCISSIKNIKTFGVANPPKFHTDIGSEIPMPFSNFRKYTMNDIRNVKDWEIMQYIITSDGKLIITPTNASKPFHRSPNSPAEWATDQIYHSDMAQLKPVYAAGDIVVKHGKIIKIDNKSGHYLPGGEHMNKLVEKVFVDNGYTESAGKYADCGYIYGSSTVAIKNRLKPKPFITKVDVGSSKDEPQDAENKYNNLLYPCSQYFNLDDLEESAKNVPTVIKQLEEFNLQNLDFNSSQGFAPSAPENVNNELSAQTRQKLLSIAEPLYEFGQIGLGLSQIALLTGGHARTWKGIAAASSSVLGLAHNISTVAMAPTLTSLSAITGFIGIAVAGIGLAMSLFGNNDEDNGIIDGINIIISQLNAIHSAIREMHQDLVKIGQRLEEILVTQVLVNLNQVNAKMDRLEKITTLSFKELHGKELIDIIDTLKKDLCGEHELTNGERREYMRKLSTWIDYHSKSPIQTFVFSLTSSNVTGCDKLKILEILKYNDFDIYCMFPLLIGLLRSFVPKCFEHGMVSDNLPNIRIFSLACDVYLLAEQRYGNKNEKLAERISNTYSNIVSIVETIQKSDICDILYRQYKYFMLLTGNTIRKYREEYKVDGVITNIVSGALSSQIEDILTEAELRYYLLKKLEILGCTVGFVYNPRNLLSQNIKEYNIFDEINKENLQTFVELMNCGLDPNKYNSWGMPIHYITKHSKYNDVSVKMLHELFKYPLVDMNGRTLTNQGDTWGVGAQPILHVMNSCKFGMAILFCANGFDIVDSDGRGVPHGLEHFNNSHCGNLYWWCENNTSGFDALAHITRDFLKNMNGNCLCAFNKEYLRKSYQYYKLAESGFDPDHIEVPLICLLLLTCIIGNLRPLKLFESQIGQKPQKKAGWFEKVGDYLKDTRGDVKINFEMIAAAYNNVDVLKYFKSLNLLGGSSKEKSGYSAFDSINENHTVAIAIIMESWDAVYYLCGCTNQGIDFNHDMLNYKLKPDQFEIVKKGKKERYEKLLSEQNKSLMVKDSAILIKTDVKELANTQIEKVKCLPKTKSAPLLPQDIYAKCQLFLKLMENYHCKTALCEEAFKSLYAAIEKGNIANIISAFNTLDAILRVGSKEYNLGSKIDILIGELNQK